MPIATPEVYAEMLDRAKAGAFAYPAINVTSSQTLNAALRDTAAVLGAREAGLLTNRPQERGARIDLEIEGFAVDGQPRHGVSSRDWGPMGRISPIMPRKASCSELPRTRPSFERSERRRRPSPSASSPPGV